VAVYCGCGGEHVPARVLRANAVRGTGGGASVVASDIPAHRELTDSQPPGIVHLLPVEASADQIAAAILDASGTQTNPPPRLRSWDDTVEKLLRIYARVTGRHDSQRRHRLL
jgi:hypothetical protein